MMRMWLWVIPLALGLLVDNSVEGTAINYVGDEGHNFRTLIKSAQGDFDKNIVLVFDFKHKVRKVHNCICS